MQHEYSYKTLGDSALMVYFGEVISLPIHNKIKTLLTVLQENPFEGFIECVPAYTNVCIHYDPVIVYNTSKKERPEEVVKKYVSALIEDMEIGQQELGRIIEIPVIYGGKYGPDLAEVSAFHGLTEQEVIQRHSESDVLVYMLGFAPGFAFMGGMDESIAMGRREVPRLKIPAGSVGIAGKQTGIYPFETPGGWNIIGRTFLPMFLPNEDPPTLLRTGDRIRFVPTSEWKEQN